MPIQNGSFARIINDNQLSANNVFGLRYKKHDLVIVRDTVTLNTRQRACIIRVPGHNVLLKTKNIPSGEPFFDSQSILETSLQPTWMPSYSASVKVKYGAGFTDVTGFVCAPRDKFLVLGFGRASADTFSKILIIVSAKGFNCEVFNFESNTAIVSKDAAAIPLDMLEPASDEKFAECSCDIAKLMVAGCTCGAINKKA